MASSELMASSASRDSDLKRELSACATTSSTADFLSIDSGSNARDDFASGSVMAGRFLSNAFVERSSVPDQSHRPVVEVESSSSTPLNTEITLLDAAGAVTPISDRESQPPRMARRTVDDVWREIVAGKKSQKQPKEEMMTLEDFLAKAGAEEEEEATQSIVEVKEEGLSGGMYNYQSGSGVIEAGMGVGYDVGSVGRGRGRRSMSLLEPLDKVQQQRQKRMIKNRESAARSRERKQAYQVELESMAVRLEEENEELLKEKAERTKKRLKQLMETVIPVVENRRPPQMRKVRSMQW